MGFFCVLFVCLFVFQKYVFFLSSIRIRPHIVTLEKQMETERDLDSLCIARQNFQQIEDREDCSTSLYQILSTCVPETEYGMRDEEQNLQSR